MRTSRSKMVRSWFHAIHWRAFLMSGQFDAVSKFCWAAAFPHAICELSWHIYRRRSSGWDHNSPAKQVAFYAPVADYRATNGAITGVNVFESGHRIWLETSRLHFARDRLPIDLQAFAGSAGIKRPQPARPVGPPPASGQSATGGNGRPRRFQRLGDRPGCGRRPGWPRPDCGIRATAGHFISYQSSLWRKPRTHHRPSRSTG